MRNFLITCKFRHFERKFKILCILGEKKKDFFSSLNIILRSHPNNKLYRFILFVTSYFCLFGNPLSIIDQCLRLCTWALIPEGPLVTRNPARHTISPVEVGVERGLFWQEGTEGQRSETLLCNKHFTKRHQSWVVV